MAGVIGSRWSVGQRGFACARDCPADCLTNDGNQVPKQATQMVFQLTGGDWVILHLTEAARPCMASWKEELFVTFNLIPSS
jgi:hypothetical protein